MIEALLFLLVALLVVALGLLFLLWQRRVSVDVSPATVVTLYLLSGSNAKLRPILTRQLKPGSRIVSHAFSMGDWTPEKTDLFTDSGGTQRTLYRWITDGTVRN